MTSNNHQRPPKIGVLIENHFDDAEYVIYNAYFPHKGYEVEYLSYLWGQPALTFGGNDHKETVTVSKCLTATNPDEYAGVILIGGYAMDRLRYSEDGRESLAVKFLRSCVASPGLKIGTMCHSLWLYCAAPDLLEGKTVTCSQNIICDVENAGGALAWVSDGVRTTVRTAVDGDLITGKHPGCVMEFVERFHSELARQREVTA